MHRLFQYGAHCLPVRERLAARAERSGGDYRTECGILTSIALAEYLSHPHTNTGNNATYSSFCTGGRLSAVSVLGVAAIGRDLKNRKNAPSISVRCTLLVIATIFIGIFTDCITVRERLAARAECSSGDYRAERRSLLQGSLLQNTDTIPTQIQETTLPVPVFAPEDGCLLYLFWELLQSGRV